MRDTFVVLNADTFIEVRLHDVIEFHRRVGAIATMVLRADAQRNDRIRIDASQRIRRIFDQPQPSPSEAAEVDTLPTRFMYAGVLVFEPRIFGYLPPGVYSITRDVYPRLLAAGEPLYGYVYDGYWRVLDTPEDLAAGRREIPARLAKHR